MSNELAEKTLDQKAWSFLNLIGQTPLGFPLGVGTVYFVTGVPVNAMGNNGDIAFRSDGGAGTTIYQRRANVWVATGA